MSGDLSQRPSHAGRRVLVTGGGSGIGRAIALAFADRHAAVLVADVSSADAQRTAREIEAAGPGTAVAAALDVSDYDAVVAALGTAADALGGPVDTVINNAGISPKHDGRPHGVWQMDPAEWRRVLDVNLSGTFNTIRAATPAMREAGEGWIVNMSSVAGKTHSPIVGVHYAATKSAIVGMTIHLAAELGPFGICVNALAPGRIETPMVAGAGEAANAEQVRLTPLGRLGQPREVADAALWLTSDEASFVTGQTVDVAGGLYMT